MIRIATLAVAATLAAPFPAAADAAFQSYSVASDESAEAIAARLAEALGDAAAITAREGVHYVDYSGFGFPAALRALVADQLDPSVAALLAPGLPVNASLAILPAGEGSELRLMLATADVDDPGSFLAPGGDGVPVGATLLMGGGGVQTCTGQLVLSQPDPVAEAADLYAGSLAAQGFEMADLSDGETSFFVGHRPGCSLFLYLQADPEGEPRSTVVINFQGE
jgi:type II secretory pathway pseudopilin PulG